MAGKTLQVTAMENIQEHRKLRKSFKEAILQLQLANQIKISDQQELLGHLVPGF